MLLFLGAGFLVFRIIHTAQVKKRASIEAAHIPAFSFIRVNGKPFTKDSLYNYKDRLIVEYFNPDCEHCQYMAKTYNRNKAGMCHYRLMMVTFADSLATTKFLRDYHLNSDTNVIALRDPFVHFGNYFGISVIPSFLVYRNNRLVNKFIGETIFSHLTGNDSTVSQKKSL